MPEPIIGVMIVDDSPTARRILSDIINGSPLMEVISAVSDPFEAVEFLKHNTPDVMVLDVQMPCMDGITFLKKLMSIKPLPVVMCSSLTERGSDVSLQCLEHGAVDIIAKPRIATKRDMEELEMRIRDTIRSAAVARYRSAQGNALTPMKTQAASGSVKTHASSSADELLPPPNATSVANIPRTQKIIAVGASTGGTEAIRQFLEPMPLDCPGIVLVQHMPEHFTEQFAKRLNDICKIRVHEAKNGDSIEPGLALLAPGSHHMLVKRSGTRYFVEIAEGPLVSRHRPSVDVLFRSVATASGKNAVGVILTGMGDDGAMGMLEMKQAGAYNFAQDKDTCVVFGMPNEAIKKGGVDQILPLSKLSMASLTRAGV
jgi:two-component system, chemotaxis family, protein-glutamate methylesterase/glutaminase